MRTSGSTSGSTPLAITVTVLCAVGIVAAIAHYGSKDSFRDPIESVELDSQPKEKPKQPAVAKNATSKDATQNSSRSNSVTNSESTKLKTESDGQPTPSTVASVSRESPSVGIDPASTAKSTPGQNSKTTPKNSDAKGSQPTKTANRPSSQPKQVSKTIAVPDGPTTRPPIPRFASDFVKAAYAKQFRDLLNEGWNRRQRNLETASRKFEAARSLHADDPRLYYAYGLVLCQHDKPDEAFQQFAQASKKASYPYLPAWRALVWWRVEEGNSQAALDVLKQLANQIEESDSVWPDDFAKHNTAKWIGRMLGFLQGPGAKSSDVAELVKRKAESIREILSANRAAAFDNGVGLVQKQSRALSAAADKQQSSQTDIRTKLKTYVTFELEMEKTRLLSLYP